MRYFQLSMHIIASMALALPFQSTLNSTSFNLTSSPDSTCGTGTGYTCLASKYGNSCSQFGYCGGNSSYYGTGCQAAYGTCLEPGPDSVISAIPPGTTSLSSPSNASLSTQSTTQYNTATLSSPSLSSVQSSALATTTDSTTISIPQTATSITPSSTSSAGVLEPSSTPNPYTQFTGNGEPDQGWPEQTEWASFDSLWTANMPQMSTSCAQFGTANNSPAEIADIKSAIQSIAQSTSVDERFVLAIMMQESTGCVRVPTTNYGVVNPGLFQSHDGAGSCNAGSGNVQDPCPSTEILQMVQDGVNGTATGAGLVQCIQQAGCSDVSKYYKAARIYNSGSIAASGNLDAGIATNGYVSDIANRLLGWHLGAA